ncbi:hypothetical protein KX928_06910 [Roseobacter sp. YSTF-M11]|uniref:Uncharacterized protein n=1 Tax=Roseobacter insulae TaxID=2859783 RepID=A0A9X1FTM3_9RHOB|nr:hypothetical protein [Roseobacter insulae]MBW4707511.1 hypothetical protein [Roseobacter insulae]
MRSFLFCVKLALCGPTVAGAHVSEQGFVLLLPTDVYMMAGVSVVALTVLALFAVPGRVVCRLFSVRKATFPSCALCRDMTSLAAFLAFAFALYLGLFGPRDPLSNLMPLGFWTVGWVVLISLSGFFGNLWAWLNPWTGMYRLLGRPQPLATLPDRLDLWPAIALLIGFGAFLLADIAPDDPTRLARFALAYWCLTMVGLLIFGPKWLKHCELGHGIFGAYGRLAPVRMRAPGGLGGPGWQILEPADLRLAGLFALILLGIGSFDGINETFWWLARIGVNPLEFPGRSAVVAPTVLGLIAAIAALVAIFALAVWLAVRISREEVSFMHAFGWLALSVLPIALVYHIAHYLTSFLVNIQYTLAALSDPFARGADLLGLQPFRVTTGFFNKITTVRAIWITQAGLVVLGHVWSILLAHRIAMDLFGSSRRAALATLPLSLFMIAYTFLGLWLLAAPKGA